MRLNSVFENVRKPGLWSFLWRGAVLGIPAASSFAWIVTLVDGLPDLIRFPTSIQLQLILKSIIGGIIFCTIPGMLGGMLAALVLRALICLTSTGASSKAAKIWGSVAGMLVGICWGYLFLKLFTGWHPEDKYPNLVKLASYLFTLSIPTAIGAVYGWLLAYWVQSSWKG